MRRYISTEPVRLETVKARVTAEEKAALEKAAQERGVTLAVLLRASATVEPPVAVIPKHIAEYERARAVLAERERCAEVVKQWLADRRKQGTAQLLKSLQGS